MEFSGTQSIAAPIEKVWAFLMDVNNVASCAPGFQSLEVLGEENWKAVVAVGVGAVKAKFTMDVTRDEMQEPEHMLIKGRGKVFFFKQKTAYEIGLGIPAEPLFRSDRKSTRLNSSH